MLAEAWGGRDAPRFEFGSPTQQPHEAGLLRLDSTKARVRLGWAPRLSLRDALAMTAHWYREQAAGAGMRRVTLSQIAAYETRLSQSRQTDPTPAGARPSPFQAMVPTPTPSGQERGTCV
jgi:CDP-glucose 4,6-dehydratase